MAALDLDEIVDVTLDEPPPPFSAIQWSGYVRGVAWVLHEAGHVIGGVEIALRSEVPVGTGLSSSAALGVAVARALSVLFAPERAARDWRCSPAWPWRRRLRRWESSIEMRQAEREGWSRLLPGSEVASRRHGEYCTVRIGLPVG